MVQHHDKPLVVVMGLGEMGLVHARNLAKDRRVRLGLACSRPDVLRSAASELCADAVYSSYGDAISDTDVTGLIIATSVDSHPEMLRQAIRGGKRYILCEKPLGHTVASIRGIREDIAAYDDPFVMVAFMRRWDPAYSQAYDMSCSNDQEDSKNENGTGEGSVKSSTGKHVMLKCTSGDAEYPEKYRREHTQSFSILTDLAVHDIDLARWLLRAEVQQVYTVLSCRIYPDLEVANDADTATVVLTMTNGATASLHLSRALSYGYNVSSELVMQHGSLSIAPHLGRVDIDQWDHTKAKRDIDPDFRVRFQQAFESEVFAFVDVVIQNRHGNSTTSSSDKENAGRDLEESEDGAVPVEKNPRYAMFEDGVKATAVAEALVQSAKTGLPADVTYE